MQAMARAIASRILHEPTLRLKRSAGDGGVSAHVHAMRELFGLDPSSEAIEGAEADVTELDSRRRARKPR
jgi:hypothetical protein